MRGYKKLLVYQRMMELIIMVYELTRKLPEEEKFGLTSQMRRASVSVLSNFVEGYIKKSGKEKLRFIEMSISSLLELEAQVDICFNLRLLDESENVHVSDKVGEVSYLLGRYASKI